MPRIQVYIAKKYYPEKNESLTVEKQKVADFLKRLPSFIAGEFTVPEANVRLFAAARGDYDVAPKDVDITVSVKFTSEDELQSKAEQVRDYAATQLTPLSVGCHLLLFEKDGWAVTN